MAQIVDLLKKNKYLILILAIAIFFRFYDYQNRWVLNQDQARDVTMALYALRNSKIPLVGSPSSAGPFNFAALYDWLVIAITFLFPFVSGTWFAFSIFSVFCVFLFYKIGDFLVNEKFGLICALLTAFSPSLVINSTDMLNTVAVLFAVSLNFYLIASLLKKAKNINLILMGFTVGLANNFHFQSLGFDSILIAFLVFNFKNIKQLLFHTLLMEIGFLISFLPNLIFDLLNNFVWSQSVLAYYFGGGGDKFYYPGRWLTDLRNFWPGLWGDTITGLSLSGYILIGVYILFILKIKQNNLKKFNLILILSLAIQVLLLRYYKGVRSREYLITFHSYFVLMSASSQKYKIYSINHLNKDELNAYYHFTPQRIYNYLYINYPNAKIH